MSYSFILCPFYLIVFSTCLLYFLKNCEVKSQWRLSETKEILVKKEGLVKPCLVDFQYHLFVSVSYQLAFNQDTFSLWTETDFVSSRNKR